MLSVDLYEEPVRTIVEDAMRCGMSGGVVSSKPILHATPAAFISHSNNRQQRDQLRRSFREVNPTFASGTCAREYYPFPEDLQSIRNGSLSSSWTLFEQKPSVMAEVCLILDVSIWLLLLLTRSHFCIELLSGVRKLGPRQWRPRTGLFGW